MKLVSRAKTGQWVDWHWSQNHTIRSVLHAWPCITQCRLWVVFCPKYLMLQGKLAGFYNKCRFISSHLEYSGTNTGLLQCATEAQCKLKIYKTITGLGHLGHREWEGRSDQEGSGHRAATTGTDPAKYSLSTVNCFINYCSTLIIFGCNVAYIAEKHDCIMFGCLTWHSRDNWLHAQVEQTSTLALTRPYTYSHPLHAACFV